MWVRLRFAVYYAWAGFFWLLRVAVVLAGVAVLVLIVLARCVPGLAPSGFDPVGAASWPTAASLSGLAVVAFWRPLWQLVSSRDISVGKEGISLTQVEGISQQLSGTLRDNTIYFGNRLLLKREYDLAYEVYAGAHRMSKSLLSVYRTMQSLAAHLKAEPVLTPADRGRLMTYFEDAVALAAGPPEDLVGRFEIAEWVMNNRKCLFQGEAGTQTLRAGLMARLKTELGWDAL